MGPGLLTDDVSQSLRYTTLGTTPQPVAEAANRQHTTLTRNIHTPGGIRTHNSSKRVAEAPRLNPRGQCEWPINRLVNAITAIWYKVRGERCTRDLLIVTCGPEEGGDIRMERSFMICALHQRSIPSLSHQRGEEVAVAYFTESTVYLYISRTPCTQCDIAGTFSLTCCTVPTKARFLDKNERCKVCSFSLYNFYPKRTPDRWILSPLQLRRVQQYVKSVPLGTVAQIPGARSPGRLKICTVAPNICGS